MMIDHINTKIAKWLAERPEKAAWKPNYNIGRPEYENFLTDVYACSLMEEEICNRGLDMKYAENLKAIILRRLDDPGLEWGGWVSTFYTATATSGQRCGAWQLTVDES